MQEATQRRLFIEFRSITNIKFLFLGLRNLGPEEHVHMKHIHTYVIFNT